MSGLYEDLPFARGATYGTTDSTIGVSLEGHEYIHQDKTYGTGRYVKVRVVRNGATIALAPKRLVNFALTAGKPETTVDGYAASTGQATAVVDELLPSAGASVGDLFYVVVEGPTLVTTSLDAGAANVIAVGDMLNAQTAAASTGTTAGRAYPVDLTGATSVLGTAILGVFGRAQSAKTTGNTAASLLIQSGRF